MKRSTKRSIARLKPCLSFNNGVMSRKRIPGSGKSGIARMRASISIGKRGFEERRRAPLRYPGGFEPSGKDRTPMKQRALATVLVAALAAGATAPALADGAASTRNIILFSAAAVPLAINYSRKVRQKRQEQKEVSRRQDAYR